MNKIIVTGNLTKDMEVEITSNDKIHGKLSIANNVGYGENQKTNFLNCDLYGQRVDTLSKYLVKGASINQWTIKCYKYRKRRWMENLCKCIC